MDFLALELQAGGSCCVGAGHLTHFLQEQQVFFTFEPSLQPLRLCLNHGLSLHLGHHALSCLFCPFFHHVLPEWRN